MSRSITTEEHSLPTVPRLEETKWEFFVDGAIHRAMERLASRVESAMASLRGPDPDAVPPPPLTTADLERLIRRIARDHEQGIRINNTGRSGPPKWLNKFILGVGVLLAASAIGATATVIVTVASIHTKIDDYIQSNDRRLDTDEATIRETERRLDRGAGT